MKLNYELITNEVKRKMEGRSLREVAPEIKISHPTLDRVLNGSNMDMETFCKVVGWLEIPVSECFIEHEAENYTVTIYYKRFIESQYVTIQVRENDPELAARKAEKYLRETYYKGLEIHIESIIPIPNI